MIDGIEFIQMDSRAPSSLLGLVAKPTARSDGFLDPHPTHDYYNDRFSFPVLVYSALTGTAVASALLLAALRTEDLRPSDIISPTATAKFQAYFLPPIVVLTGYLGFCVLLSLVFEISTPKATAYRLWCRFLHFVLFTVILILPSISYTFVLFLSFSCTAAYVIMSGVHMWRKHKTKGMQLNEMS